MEMKGNNSNMSPAGTLRHLAARFCNSLLLLSILPVISGCVAMPTADSSTHSTVAVTDLSDTDTELLARIAPLQTGQRDTYNGMTLEAGQSYNAASGRLCKPITLSDTETTDTARTRLACRGSGNWFFAIDIFSSGTRGN